MNMVNDMYLTSKQLGNIFGCEVNEVLHIVSLDVR